MSALIQFWLNLAVLTVTALVVTWYTIETHKLRKAAQLQTELQTRPFLSLARTGPGDGAKFCIHNAGHGLARNISFEEARPGPLNYLRAEPISHLGPGEDVVPTWLALAANREGDAPDVTPDNDLANFALARRTTTFALNYKSIVGWTYTTVVSISAGRIEIVSDSGEQPRPSKRRRR